MDKIWDGKSFEVGGHWPLRRGSKNEWRRRTDNSRTLKKQNKKQQKPIQVIIFEFQNIS